VTEKVEILEEQEDNSNSEDRSDDIIDEQKENDNGREEN